MTALVEKTAAGNPDSLGQAIYPVLAKHQRDEQWAGRELIAELQEWAERFIVEFKLDIPVVTLCVDQLPTTRYGHYRNGHNGFGLRGEIAINDRYLNGKRQMWEVLGTLLHELLHAWQEIHGTPGKRNHHNAELREKARELGLIIDRRGVTGYEAGSPFKDFIRRFGIEAPAHEVAPAAHRPASRSKLKKWSCGCTNVRVAVTTFKALCLNCGKEFTLDETVKDRTPQG